MELLEQVVVAPLDERAARRTLRRQIARLDRELGIAAAGAHPRFEVRSLTRSLAGPRVLSLGELERVRDELAGGLREIRALVAEQAERQTEARLLLERMVADPRRHKWVRVTNLDIGRPGCTAWHVRPVLGPIGILTGWWRVKISSGCPLPDGSPHPQAGRGARA
jgi:hypothetical protein